MESPQILYDSLLVRDINIDSIEQFSKLSINKCKQITKKDEEKHSYGSKHYYLFIYLLLLDYKQKVKNIFGELSEVFLGEISEEQVKKNGDIYQFRIKLLAVLKLCEFIYNGQKKDIIKEIQTGLLDWVEKNKLKDVLNNLNRYVNGQTKTLYVDVKHFVTNANCDWIINVVRKL